MILYEWLRAEEITTREVDDINKLLSQLTDSPRLLTREKLCEVAQKSLMLVAVTRGGEIKGMNTMTISYLPTGRVGRLDDVVADESLRGQGVGEELVRRLIERAKQEQVDRVELTCKPTRAAANKLYQKLGFKQRETNCYMMKLDKEIEG